VVATVASDAFTEYAVVLLDSIRRHNPWFVRLPLRVFWSPQLAPLSRVNQERIRQAHAKTTFVEVDGAAYERYRPETPPRLMAALLTLEVFGIRDADRVVFLDADMVCLGDPTELFELDVDLAGCPTGSSRAAKEARAGAFHRRVSVNTGVLVIGRRYLNDATRRRLARCPSGQFADQDVLNRFVRGRSVYCLDHRFNYHAEFFWRGDETDVRLLHYAGTKPLEAPDLPRMRPWFAARERQRPHP
jgi:lipopolysaccharide biosynthesis glycosyltransferase